MKTFSFTGAKKIVFGKGSFVSLPEQLAEQKVVRPLVVLDRNLAETGFREKVSALLDQAGMKYALYDKTEPEPPLELADEGTKIALKNKCDGVVGIGGGSAMDLAKAIAVLAANKAKAEEFLGLNRVPGPGLPKIMIPTTAGTGSEVTFTSVFIRKKLKKKEGMNSPYLYPELALLDPELTLSLPPHPTAATGIDALCHAIESYTSINASPMSEMISLEAIQLISDNLRTAVHDGSNIEAREAMLLGSLYAGLGLANAGVTAVHRAGDSRERFSRDGEGGDDGCPASRQQPVQDDDRGYGRHLPGVLLIEKGDRSLFPGENRSVPFFRDKGGMKLWPVRN